MCQVLNLYLKVVKMVNSMLIEFYHNLKKVAKLPSFVRFKIVF